LSITPHNEEEDEQKIFHDIKKITKIILDPYRENYGSKEIFINGKLFPFSLQSKKCFFGIFSFTLFFILRNSSERIKIIRKLQFSIKKDSPYLNNLILSSLWQFIFIHFFLLFNQL
jgi:hypothetical protein